MIINFGIVGSIITLTALIAVVYLFRRIWSLIIGNR